VGTSGRFPRGRLPAPCTPERLLGAAGIVEGAGGRGQRPGEERVDLCGHAGRDEAHGLEAAADVLSFADVEQALGAQHELLPPGPQGDLPASWAFGAEEHQIGKRLLNGEPIFVGGSGAPGAVVGEGDDRLGEQPQARTQVQVGVEGVAL
jgi:hypothetical protein